MRALLYDVHGNIPALQAVLADARERGVAGFLVGGDIAAFGAWPTQALAAVDALEADVVIRGNHERWLVEEPEATDPAVHAAVAWERAQLPAADVERLAALPETATLADGTLLCHASPQSDMRSFTPTPADDEAELLAGAPGIRRIVFGHTHLQFRRIAADGTELVNPGSVGMPLDGDLRAAYATITEDGVVELHRVAYDVEATRSALTALGEPWTAWVLASYAPRP